MFQALENIYFSIKKASGGGSGGGSGNEYNAEIETTIVGSEVCDLQKYVKRLPKGFKISGTTCANMFNGASALTEFPEGVDTSQVINMMQMFYGCSNLKDVYPFSMASVVNGTISRHYMMFSGCTLLTDEALNNIMASCITGIKITKNKTLVELGLNNDQIARCKTLSNYQAFYNAGWRAS